MKYAGIREEELKIRVAQEYFWLYDCARIIGNIDFSVTSHYSEKEVHEIESFLWAEAKKGSADIYKAITQLILTIGKARTFDKYLPPAYLGAFDAEKMAFIPYSEISHVFYMNDFNWNVAPSNYETREFNLVLNKVKETIDKNVLLFYYEKDSRELRRFVKENFVLGKFGTTKIRIDKNNFMIIYNKWLQTVKPTIAIHWNVAKKSNIIEGDFYLADLLSEDNFTLKDKLYVLLKKDHYELGRKIDEIGLFTSSKTGFIDGQKAHTQFWNKYERPPKEEYWEYIVERRDLLVPQDIRERKGSFFTPQVWVELSQKYLADVLGENWQDEYYIWDCAAGTGNLLTGLTNKYNIFASTLDRQDVEVMHDRIQNGANLFPQNVFQFDFLNDDFIPQSKGGKLPDTLYNIITDENKRKKLVIYINPPYAETAKNQTHNKARINKRGVSFTKVQKEYADKIGIGTKELFAQFLTRVYAEIPGSILAQFSKLKTVQGPNFHEFRQFFRAKFLKGFICPSYTFDNVAGKFPIGFMIWRLDGKSKIKKITCDVFEKDAQKLGTKTLYAYKEGNFITDWFREYHYRENGEKCIGSIGLYGSDFQHNNFIAIYNIENHPNRWTYITPHNLIPACIYFSVRHCIKATWLNDRDQFLYPNKSWKQDKEFQNDCLTFALFHGQNKVSSKHGINHWIPFTEYEVNAQQKFESNFMSKFIKGKIPPKKNMNIFSVLLEEQVHYEVPLTFSPEATAVFEAGKALWQYYHGYTFSPFDGRGTYNPNASLYDIKEYFQGRNEKGKMNNTSTDETYNLLLARLKDALDALAEKIEVKVYEHEFLKV